jgi:hypothetical protein
MASEHPEAHHPPKLQVFVCESDPLPPGTKSRARLPRGLEPEPSPWRIWWILGGATVVAFLLGVVVGRFLLS